MARLHCERCPWSQDDFWSADYNPIKGVQFWEGNLLKFEQLDQPGTNNAEFIRKHGDMTSRVWIAQQLKKASKLIQDQVFLTPEQTKGQPCPKCGHENLVID